MKLVVFLVLFLISSFFVYPSNEFGIDMFTDSLYLCLKAKFEEAEKNKDFDAVTEEIISISEYYKKKSEYTKAVIIVTNFMNQLPTQNKLAKAKCLLQLGELNRAVEDSKESLVFLKDALVLFKNLNHSKGIGKVYNRLAAVYFEQKEFDSANRYIDSSMVYATYADDKILIASNMEIKGAIHHSKKEYINATKLFLEVIKIYNILNLTPDANVYINLCITYLYMKDYKKSIYYGEIAYDLAKKQDILIYIENVCLFLSEAYSNFGNFEKAYEYSREGYSTSLKLFNQRKNIEILELNRKYENEKIILQIDNQRFKLEQKNKLNYLFGLIFLLLTVGLIILIIVSKKIKKSNRLLQSKNNEITEQREKIELQSNKIKQKAADLMVLNMQLKEIDTLKVGLTAMLVHDLKNPINNILSLSDKKEVISFANQMLVIVNNILDVQKYESARMKLEVHDYFLKDIINNAIEQIIILAEHKNIKIVLENNYNNNVAVDFEIIQRVVVNLLTNSIKYTPHNGSITIYTHICKTNDSCVEIEVKDNGIGIRKDKIKSIFNKFNQIIAIDSGHARSTGLGLTFCKLAVEAHNGEIYVVSEPGEYTVFKFTLPASDKKLNPNNINVVQNTGSIFYLNNNEKEFLREIVINLMNTDVYDIGNLRKLTQNIDETYSANVEIWKRELNRSIYNCNHEYYKELIKSASSK
jgi:signal transduction histidine kinase